MSRQLGSPPRPLPAVIRVIAVICSAAMLALTAPRAAATTPPALSVSGASLTVASTGERLYGVNADRELLIASTTKMMTALVVLQHITDLSQIFTAPNFRASSVDSQIGLSPGETMSVHDLMLALLLPSADDAAYDLAYNVGGGSIERFVTEMNADAVSLGLTHTHYENPIGLDSPENYSSPYDLTRLAAYMLAHFPFFAQSVRLTHATLSSGDYVRNITNTDTLLGTEPWITGVKSGHTNAAGYILVSSGSQHGLTLVASVLGTSSEAARNANALALLQYGFAQFRQFTPIRDGEVIRRIPVTGEGRRAVVIAATAFTNVLPRSDRISFRFTLPSKLTGSLKARARVGTARVFVDGHLAATIPLVLGRAVPAEPALTTLAHFVGGPTTLGLLAMVVGVALTVKELRRRRPRMAPDVAR